jgi:hypothetical protein
VVLKITISLDIINCPSLIKNETFQKLDCLRHQVKPTLLGPVDRAGYPLSSYRTGVKNLFFKFLFMFLFYLRQPSGSSMETFKY